MIATYDFVFYAYRDQTFMRELQQAMMNDYDTMVYTEKHVLSFDAYSSTVLVKAKSPDSVRIIPKMITYEGLSKMLNGVWDNFKEGDIVDVE